MIYLIWVVVAAMAGGVVVWWRRRKMALLEAEVDAFLGTDSCLCCGFDNLEPLSEDDLMADEELLMHLLIDLEDPELYEEDAQASRGTSRDVDALSKSPVGR